MGAGPFDLLAGLIGNDDRAAAPHRPPVHHDANISALKPAPAASPDGAGVASTAPRDTLTVSPAGPTATPAPAPINQDLLAALAAAPLGSAASTDPSPATGAAPAPAVPAPAAAATVGTVNGLGNTGSGPELNNGPREVLHVPTTTTVGVNSRTVLQAGVTYTLVASGNFRYGAAQTDWADAQYHHYAAPTPYAPDGVTPIGLEITGVRISTPFPRWGRYQPTHTYTLEVIGQGQPLHAYYRDATSSYGTHQGTLQLTVQQGDCGGPPVPPIPPCDSCTNAGDLVGTAPGADGGYGADQAYSGSGVRYADGTLRDDTTDLSSSGFGIPWGQDRTFSNLFMCASEGPGPFGGSGWAVSEAPYLLHYAPDNAPAEVILVSSSTNYHFFTETCNGQSCTYTPWWFLRENMTAQTDHHYLVFTDSKGQVFTFNDFSSFWNPYQQGELYQVQDAAGNTLRMTYAGTTSKLAEMDRFSAGNAALEQYIYNYDPNYVQLLQVVYKRIETGTMNWSEEREVDYTYYTGASNQYGGNLGDLLYATIEEFDPITHQLDVIDTKYYRYYTIDDTVGAGYLDGLKYAFNPQSYARLQAALKGTDPTTLTDAQFTQYAGYADDYFQYDGSNSQAVTQAVIQGAGCSSCSGGLGTYTYTYTVGNPNPGHVPGYNSWEVKTVEMLPDGNTNTVYTNKYGQIMLTVFQAAGQPGQWETYYRYGASGSDAVQGQTVLVAAPSALSGYDYHCDALVDSYNSMTRTCTANAYLNASSGLIRSNTFYGTTDTAPGFLKSTFLQQGLNGTPVIQSSMTYFTPPGKQTFFVTSKTVYRNGDPMDMSEQTSYAYGFYPGTVQPSSVTVIKPLITTDQNGPGGTANDQETTDYDTFGRITQTTDGDGYVNTYQYDPGTGGLIQAVVDANHLNLVTTYTVDGLGRETSMTEPNQSPYPVSTTYIVYDDVDHETRTYPGWHYDSGKSAWLPTGPTQVSREDRATTMLYDETLTMDAAPALDMNNHPTGTEPIGQVQSLSRDLTDNAGQVVEHDNYVDVGPGYSTTPMIVGAHYNATMSGYDMRGRPNRSVSANNTIQRTVYDGLSRVVSTWVGTNDVGATDGDPTGNHTPGNNMIQVSADFYDQNMPNGVGDGNLTEMVQYPHGTSDPANPPRETENVFDWRDRVVVSKQGVQGSGEDTTTHRPLIYTVYDNVNEVMTQERFLADGVDPTMFLQSDGTPDPMYLPKLRAKTTTAYDNQGRVYLTDTYSVDTNGTISAVPLVTNDWYNHRGELVKTSSPGGLVQKMSYDGAGRETFVFTTDGFGDAAPGTAQSWSDAQQVNSGSNGTNGNTVLTQTQTQYDGDGNPVFVTTWDRYHNATYTGDLSKAPTQQARASFDGKYYDAADRLTLDVNFGNNGNNFMTGRPLAVSFRGTTPAQETNYAYTADTVQTVALSSGTRGGTFTLSFNGSQPVTINFNDSAAAVQNALNTIAALTGNVMVTGPTGASMTPGGPWNVRFTGTLAGQNEPLLTANGSGLTGGSVTVALASQAGDAGRVQAVTDPRGLVTKTDYDLAGRTLRTVAAFNNNPAFVNNWNQVTEYTYDGDNHVVTLTAYPGDSSGSIQQTQYTYTANPADSSWISSNDQLTKVQYPDKSSGRPSTQPGDQEIYQYDNLGETRTKTERTGTVHSYSFDVLGRPTLDSVSTFGMNVDPTVGGLGIAYDTYGNAVTFTSYAPNGTTILNQVQRTYNGFGQLTAEAQCHSGSVASCGATVPTVSYAYSTPAMNMNYSRLMSMTYPNGQRQLDYSYGNGNDTLDNTISRLTAITDHSSGTVLETYIDGSNAYADYLGLDTVVQRSHPQTGINLTYLGGSSDANDQYGGLDRFGRVVDQNWQGPAGSTDHFQYGYDYDGNRLYEANLVTEGLQTPLSFDELYHASGVVDTYNAFGQLQSAGYDVLNQMTAFYRGTLSTDRTSISNTSNTKHNQSWTLDALGNWTQFVSDTSTQSRTTNQQNELTAINGVGLGYDNNGNTTTDDQGNHYVYDAWNRLVSASNSGMMLLASYGYDALGRRIQEVETNSFGDAVTRDLYFSDQWQVLEEHETSAGHYTNLVRAQYVWSPVYVDALVERDRDPAQYGSGSLSERLYVQQDANFNVTALVDTTGTVQERFVYDPYGKSTDASGQNVGALNGNWSTKTGGDSYGWVYLHQGGRYDAVTGLYNFRNRDYSPTLGRWMQDDPAPRGMEDLNLYKYVDDNPSSSIDPSGLERFNPRDQQKDLENLKHHSWNQPSPPPPFYKDDRHTPGFKICQRDIIADDSYDRCANNCGGQHTYIQLGPIDQKGRPLPGTKGVGWAGGPPVWEQAFRPNSCANCKKNAIPLPFGSGAGKLATVATDDEILDCLKNYPPKQHFSWYWYNCRAWAYEAARGCGLSCAAKAKTPTRCFTEGTLVHTRSGNKPIEKVTVGEEVLSWDERKGEFTYRPVTDTLSGKRGALVELRVGDWSVTCSPDHRFLTADSLWKKAEDLKPSDLIRSAGFQFLSVAEVKVVKIPESVTVFNFEVAETHNYCVALPGLVAHNFK